VTEDDKAFLRRLVDERIETGVRKVVAEELRGFFETGDDAAEMRRVKDGIRWAAERREAAAENWKSATIEFIKLALGAAFGAAVTWFWHGVSK
jgi:hypothetical protein